MAYPGMPLYVRKDPFGPASHNNVLQRTDHLVQMLGVEHDPITGRHNTPHVARTLGHITWDGANYGSDGFSSYFDSVGSVVTGTVVLRFTGNGITKENAVIEIQPADDSGGGDGNPWFASTEWIEDDELNVYLKKNTASVDVQQVLAAANGDFFIGVRSSALSTTAPGNGSDRRVRGNGLQVSDSDWNPGIQKLGDNRHASLLTHTSSGLHNVREVAKAWGYVKWNSAASSYTLAAHQGLGAGIVRQSQGCVRVYLANCVPAISAPVQAFARAVTAVTGTAHVGLRKAMVPQSSCVAASVDVYLYESYVDAGPPVTYRWRRVDGDFFVRVHGA